MKSRACLKYVVALSLSPAAVASANTTAYIKLVELSEGPGAFSYQLPNGYENMLVDVAGVSGAIPNITLPANPKDGDQVVIPSPPLDEKDPFAGLISFFDGIGQKFNIKNHFWLGDCGHCFFRYNKEKDHWIVSGTNVKYVSSSKRGAIPADEEGITVYEVDSMANLHPIKLPPYGRYLTIISSAGDVQIDTANLFSAWSGARSTSYDATIPKGQSVGLVYDSYNKKWWLGGPNRSPEQ